jgi:AcrR family transcriptional regulator
VSAEPARPKGATGDRAATEAVLERSALSLLRERGILGGLNLREVADEAGVNRGLVYHYFGGGRDLLRAALRKDMSARMSELGPGRGRSFSARARSYVHAMVHQAEWVRVVVILLLDNDERVRLLPLKDEVLPDLRDRQVRGEITAEVDIEAFHVLQVSSGYGYALAREAMARELDLDLEDLDRRVAETAGQIAGLLTTDANETS